MTDPVNNMSSSTAGIQMTALAAVQSQLTAESNRQAASPVQAATPVQAAAAALQAKVDSADTQGATASKTTEPSAKELAAATTQLQQYFQPDQKVTLQVDHASGQSYVKIVDAKSKQLILQIPSKEVLAMAQKLRSMANPQAASGVLVDQQG